MNEEQLQYLEQVVSQLEQEWFTIRLVEVRTLLAEVRTLRAKLDAVPVSALLRDWTGWGNNDTSAAIEVWMQSLYELENQQAEQADQPDEPDEPDRPLTLAGMDDDDEDGDL